MRCGPCVVSLSFALVLALGLLSPAVVRAEEGAGEEHLPRYMGARLAARELVIAFEADELKRFDALLGVPSPSLVRVAATLLNPPQREPSDTERAVLQRMAKQAPAATGVPAFLTFWLGASEAVRQAERARWGLSARFVMRLRGGKEKEALALLQPELADLRAAAFSHQASDLLRSYTYFLLQKGRFVEAEPELRSLVARLRHEKRSHDELPILFMHAHALRGLSRESDAMPVYERAQVLATRIGQWRHACGAALERGVHAKRAGKLAASDALLHEALALAEASGNVPMGVRARAWLARLARSQGRPRVAERQAVRAFEAGKDAPRPNGAADAAAMLVLFMRDHGRMAEALRYGAWLEDNLERVTSNEARGVSRRALAQLAIRRGAHAEAASHLEQALRAFADSPVGQRGRLSVLTDLLTWGSVDAGQRTAYLAAHRALVETEAHGARASWILADAARLERALGNGEQARALADRALEAARASPDVLARHRGLAGKARDLLAEQAWEQALALYAEARASAPETSPHMQTYRVQEGRCLIALGRPAEAVDRLRQALRVSASARRGVSGRDALGLRAAEHAVANVGVQAAHAWSEREPGAAQQAVAAAWWFREQGSARLLAEALEEGSPRGRAETGVRLAQAMNAVEDTQRRLIVAIARGALPRQKALRAQLESEHAVLRGIGRRVARRSTPQASGAAELPAVQATLGEHEAVLSFAVTEDGIYGMAVDRTGASFKRLGDTAKVRDLLWRWKLLASTPDGPDAKLAARLYDSLIRPLEERLAGSDRWTVLAEGPLAGVPLDAWLRTDGERSVRVIERHTIRYAHSASVAQCLGARAADRPAGRGIVALGDPSYPAPEPLTVVQARPTLAARLRGGVLLPRLPASAREVRRVAALFPVAERTTLLGEHATGERLLEVLAARKAPLRALHLACHGIVDDELPTLSGLVFADGAVLTAERLETLHLEVGLVVLSACDSGAGASSVGEGVLGLTRALFLAGVSQVVCSTWQVADASTATLMERLHEGRERAGLDAASALRAARLTLLRDPQTAHPFHWAGLQLWGQAGR